MYKVSIVSYSNSFPFLFGIQNSLLANEIELHEDIPSQCLAKLLSNEVDVGLIPVAGLLESNKLNIVSDYCIGANGKVDSVKLYSSVPVNQISTVRLDYQSRTSVNLCKVLLKNYWKKEVQFENTHDRFWENLSKGEAAVVIGDRTFNLNGTFPFEYDLSEEWQKMTGMPFVFAVWASIKNIDNKWLTRFNSALKLGLDNRSESIKPYLHLHSGFDLENYVHRTIDYTLDVSKKAAIDLFLKMVSNL
jgi:chorismate dehydratase